MTQPPGGNIRAAHDLSGLALLNRAELTRRSDTRPTERDAYAEAVVRVGENAYLMGDAVLGLLGLAMVEPKRIKVGVPHRIRQKDPGFVDVVQRYLPAAVITTYEGIARLRSPKHCSTLGGQ